MSSTDARYQRYADIWECQETAESIECGWRALHWAFMENSGYSYAFGVVTDHTRAAQRIAQREGRPDEPVTDVIFRVWRGRHGRVIALFPYEPGTVSRPETCGSFEHIGQHGAAWVADVTSATRPASLAEFAPLRRELESEPYRYRLRIRGRIPKGAAEARSHALYNRKKRGQIHDDQDEQVTRSPTASGARIYRHHDAG